MPKIEVYTETLMDYIGADLDVEELEKLLPVAKAELDDIDPEVGLMKIDLGDTNRPDLVVTDLRLGDEDGMDLIDRLRGKFGDLPAIFITGYGDARSLSEASRRRPVEMLNKPIDLERLREAVGAALRVRREGRQEYGLLSATCEDLMATCRQLHADRDRQEALIRYQTRLLDCGDQDDIFRNFFQVFVERTGGLCGAALMGADADELQLVGRFGVPVPDGINFCRALAGSVVPLLDERPEVTILDAQENIELFPQDMHRMLVGVSLLLIPLLARDGRLVGAVMLYRKGEQPFTDDDVALAELVGAPTAVAVQKAA